jgi:hypothetical protein
MHIGNIRQTCVIKGIMDKKEGGLQTNDTASVLFKFLSHPEYLHVGMQLLLREGQTKAVGKITQIFPLLKVGVLKSTNITNITLFHTNNKIFSK